ncbi:tetratricopeptide repeat protein [Paraburkholderia sp. RL17-337-BIB-A]|uniref:tetratricopeptide repeat protein n=1 Tax=Paraburkholderia sp. RL17-337-BIB-A TaxID=3031636 RepID=UPI0038B8A79F
MKTGPRRTDESGWPNAPITANRQKRVRAALFVCNHRLIAAIITMAPLAIGNASAMTATETEPALSSSESTGTGEANPNDAATRHSQKYRDAFSAMMADPANAERSFEFACAAASDDDIRGAIAALERILKINPGLANIRLQLGELYLRVNATDLAATYLCQALLAPDIPPPLSRYEREPRQDRKVSRSGTAADRRQLAGGFLGH